MMLRAGLAGIMALALSPAAALNLPTNATLTFEKAEALASFDLAVGAFAEGRVEKLQIEGAVNHSAWRIPGSGKTTLQLLAPLRDELKAEGFEVLFDCAAQACGGFDFRYATYVLPEPDMHIDLGDFRYLAAARFDGEEPDYIALLVSRSSENGFVQMTRVGAPSGEPVAIATSTKTLPTEPAPALDGGVVRMLTETGGAVLDDLRFNTGSADLGNDTFASLAELAAWLVANPGHRVTLVGHTDTDGPLAANVALSKRRAASVARRLVTAYNVPSGQVTAEGVGFLAPRASNLTDEGRNRNRRVEVVLSATE